MDEAPGEGNDQVLIRFNFDKETNSIARETRRENPIEFEDEDEYDEVEEISYEPEKVRKDDEHSSDDIMQFAEIKDVENFYECSMCNYSTQNKGSLRKHKAAMHGPAKDFQCKFCNRKFATQMQKHIHVQKKHAKKFHKCPYCTHTTISGRKDMENHVKQTHPGCEYGNKIKFDGFIRVGLKGLYRCDKCSYVERKLEPMAAHAKMHKSKFILKCLHCHFMADSQKLYRQHLETDHKLAKEIYICKKCYFQSENWTEYTSHILEPHQNHECTECFYSTPDVDIFYAHFELHKSKNKCHKCDYVGETAKDLKEHLDTQHEQNSESTQLLVNDIEIEEFIERRENLDISDEKLIDAINGVKNKIISVSEASAIFQIPIDYLYSKTRDEGTVEMQDIQVEKNIEQPAVENPKQENTNTSENREKDLVSSSRFKIEPFRGFDETEKIPEETNEAAETQDDAIEDEPLMKPNEQTKNLFFTIDEVQTTKIFSCKVCSFKASELSHFEAHFEEQHGGILNCPHCPFVVVSDAEEFQKHLNEHCSHCSFQSSDSNKLKLHILSHVPKYRSSNSSLAGSKEKIRIIIEENKQQSSEHEGIQIIVDSSDVVNPENNSNNSEEPDSMNIIGRPIKVIKIYKNQCFDCLGIFKSRYSLVDHRKRFHNLKKPHSCTYCMEVFESYKNLKSHYYRVHQATFHNTGPIFKCPLCDFNCDLLKPITRHVIKNHKRTPNGFKTSKLQ